MKEWKKILVKPTATIVEVMKTINDNASQFAIVIDVNHRLIGTITDGDIRRAILKGVNLTDECIAAMNKSPTTTTKTASHESLLELMRTKKIHHIPVIDENSIIIDLKSLNEVATENIKRDNPVVIMAGGLGTRLGELTTDSPKSMLKVGKKPILEIIIENFRNQGFHNFYLSVNYKSEIIEQYFQDGNNHDVSITYLKENKRLGTAGSLSLIEDHHELPLIIMNGDLLTKINFPDLLQFHNANINSATMCIRKYEFQVPFGVITTQNEKIISIEEKPVQQFFVNAGIYVLSSEAIKLIPKDTFFDMPMLFNTLINKEIQTGVFPIHEYWLDIGQRDDFEKAQDDIKKL